MYIIKGKLTGPNGKKLYVRSFWFKEYSSEITKFVTMYPDNKDETHEI